MHIIWTLPRPDTHTAHRLAAAPACKITLNRLGMNREEGSRFRCLNENRIGIGNVDIGTTMRYVHATRDGKRRAVDASVMRGKENLSQTLEKSVNKAGKR